MEVKNIDESYKQEILDLYENSGFDLCNPFFKYLQKEDSLFKFFFGVFIQNKLVTIHNAIPAKMSLKKQQLNVLYLSYMTTSPLCRRQGLSKVLFTHTLKHAKQQNCLALIMHPFNHGFYWNLGFSSAFPNWCLKVPSKLFKSSFTLSAPKNKVKIEFLRDQKHFEIFWQMKQYFWSICPNYKSNLIVPYTFLRIKMYSKLIIAYYIEQNRRGYMLYEIKNEQVLIHEIQYNDKNIFSYFLDILQSYKLHCTEYCFENVNYNFPIEMLVENYGDVSDNVLLFYDPFRMIRIVNLYDMLLNTCNLQIKGHLSIKVQDNLIAENNRIYIFDGQGQIQEIDNNNYYMCSTDIKSIAELITGKTSPENLLLTQRLQVKDQKYLKLMSKIFAKHEHLSLDIY